MSAHLHFLKVILCLKDWVWCVSAGLHFKKKKKKKKSAGKQWVDISP